MPGYLNKTEVLDPALNVIKNGVTKIRICSALPANYTESSSTYLLGTKTVTAGSGFTGPTDYLTTGRKISSVAVADGAVSGTNTATHWAVDDGTSKLYAANTLASSQAVTNNNTFTLTSFDISMPGVT